MIGSVLPSTREMKLLDGVQQRATEIVKDTGADLGGLGLFILEKTRLRGISSVCINA